MSSLLCGHRNTGVCDFRGCAVHSGDHVDNMAIVIHVIAGTAVKDALMKHQRVARPARNDVPDRNIFFRHALWRKLRTVVAARNNHDIPHVLSRLVREKVPDPKLDERRWKRQPPKWVNSAPILVQALPVESVWGNRTPARLQDEMVAEQRACLGQYRCRRAQRQHENAVRSYAVAPVFPRARARARDVPFRAVVRPDV